MGALFVPIPKAVSDQIAKREEKHASRTRDKQTLEYLNSNTGWVRLRSGVNVLDDSTASSYYRKGGSPPSGLSTLARSTVLSGGTLNYNENPNYGSQNPRGGVSFRDDTAQSLGAYHTSPTTGFRPMPGIVGASIVSKGEYGVLRKASIQLKVFSKEDLDNIEKLFFRLGYTALLEWGHSVFVDNGGNVQIATKENYIENSLWFGYNNDSSIVTQLNNLKGVASQNYEAMYGRISNFSWRLTNDGSYDCTVDITSKGIIVDGLLIGKPSDGADDTEYKVKGAEEDLEENKSIFHYIFTKLEAKKELKQISFKEELKKADGGNLKVASFFTDQDQGFRLGYSVGTGGNWATKLVLNSDVYPVYFTLRSLLRIINEIGFPKKEDKSQLVKFDLNAENKYRTFPQHFTLDPQVTILPKIPSGLDIPEGFYPKQDNYPTALSDMVNYANANGGGDNILNILISTSLVSGIVSGIVSGPTEPGTGVLDMVKSLLAILKDTMGNVNDFYVHYDEDTALFSIVDDFGPKTKKASKIKLNGLGSTILNVSTESRISGDMSAAVSIATQGSLSNYSDPLSHLVRFNKGCVDRHQPSAAIGDAKPLEVSTIRSKNKELFKRYEEAWNDFNKKEVVNPEVWSQMKEQGKALCNFYAAQNEFDSGSPMCVPVYLNLTMKGISGFAVGYVFELDTELLPDVYNNYAYVVRGVEHTIDTTGQWVTQITASMYSLDSL